ncbi:hypothetical protein T2_00008 [Ralstonia phage Elie]|uniref:Uncharacterized protein n=2 Tax=Bakolyvirus simangalove TaxID=2846051 RepID=A0A7G5BBN7_9CAUD|nr:hypothetical protein KE332_gp08 [Ralstonia phage Adzire]YP_010077695.1 hypothetical protein KMC38_gp08 [Ralstonia phage Simangalove]QMV32953.1 hypothetical protein T2_00008 [Ralstonia phage Elie]QMV33665.1 hypothetical protein S3_00021 [Ralstonia phage Sarlave]QMV32325.1 hypothetical protein S1_00008 [Ralstonia phage Adzire]QMV33710.1 hypothetical protein R1_00008 [Ralstonia phage Simangalove]
MSHELSDDEQDALSFAVDTIQERYGVNDPMAEQLRKLLASAATVAETGERPCTCHPDDNPPKPCAKQYAYDECVKAAQQQAEPGADERATFENWMRSNRYDVGVFDSGEYHNVFARYAWMSWKARAAQSGQRASVAEGWHFYSADFSTNANQPHVQGNVMLIRDDRGRKWWHNLPEEEREEVALFVTGHGMSFDAAMLDANAKAAIAAAPTQQQEEK